jgi:hypothetical protein
MTTDLMMMPDDGKCDFCSQPLGPWCFIAKTDGFELVPGQALVRLMSDAHWGACEACTPLIEARNKIAVLRRSTSLAPAGIGPLPIALFQERLFWRHFKGEKHPASEHPRAGEER